MTYSSAGSLSTKWLLSLGGLPGGEVSGRSGGSLLGGEDWGRSGGSLSGGGASGTGGGFSA